MNTIDTEAGLRFDRDVHTNITAKANDDSGGLLNVKQLRWVVKANRDQDWHQTESKFHFDNCAFEEGVNYIQSQWSMIDFCDDHYSEAALHAFGRLLHAVQDFYSHSDWVERHLDEESIPVWDLDVKSLPSGLVSGTWKLGFPKKCSSGTPSHGELNKDNRNSSKGKVIVNSGPHKGKSLFELAFEAAVRASIEQFDRLKLAAVRLGLDSTTSEKDLTQDLVTESLAALAERTEGLRDRM